MLVRQERSERASGASVSNSIFHLLNLTEEDVFEELEHNEKFQVVREVRSKAAC